ncbi:MAG: hypothetical protein K0U98_15665 [Deltaproteobacteria bacterium]|nr:hypothetical protein [Deltaproteobacteria bacterium]
MQKRADCVRALTCFGLGIVSLSPLLGGPAESAELAEQVVDLFPTQSSQSSLGSGPGNYQRLRDRVVFFAVTPSTGLEVWASDGSSEGTELLVDVCPGPCPSQQGFLAATEEVAFFLGLNSVSPGDGGLYLWRTDGTRTGTFALLKGYSGNPTVLQGSGLIHDNFLYFAHIGAESGSQLWKSDGTLEGTVQVSNIPGGGVQSGKTNLQVLDDHIFFAAITSPSRDAELWRSDGTAEGTTFYSSHGSTFGGSPSPIHAGTDQIFFLARTEESDQLWAVDSQSTIPVQLTHFPAQTTLKAVGAKGSRFYFIGPGPGAGSGEDKELWESDGTTAGTRRITNLEEDNPFSSLNPPPFERVGDTLVFIAAESTDDSLWRTNGNPQSTERLVSSTVEYRDLGLVAGKVFFTARQDGEDPELWLTDGTTTGSHPLADFCSSPCRRATSRGISNGAELFFQGEDQFGNPQLWQTNGTAEGTQKLTNFSEFHKLGPRLSTPWVARGQDHFFLTISEPDHGAEPWILDDSPKGARLLLDIAKESESASPRSLVTSRDELLFIATLPPQNEQHFPSTAIARTNNEDESTRILRDFREGEGDVPRSLFSARDLVFFSVAAESGVQIWVIDPSTDTPRMLRSFGEPLTTPDRSTPSSFIESGGSVFFAIPSGRDQGIWKTDGTSAGTEKVSKFGSTQFLQIGGLQAAGDRLFFATSDNTHHASFWASDISLDSPSRLFDFGEFGFETLLGTQVLPFESQFILTLCTSPSLSFWTSDGTAAGTSQPIERPLGCLHSQWAASYIATPFHEEFFFMAGQNENFAFGLWRSDGTSEGTRALHLNPHIPSETPAPELVVAGERLFFGLNGEGTGFELWTSLGAAGSTHLVKDIRPGTFSSRPHNLLTVDDRLYFVANDGLHGSELWVSDGTEVGTKLVHDIYPGAQSSAPEELTVAGDKLYFSADDGLTGRELWVLPLNASGPPCRASDTALCLQDGRFKVEMQWTDFQDRTGAGQAVSITEDTGYFWFFSDQNVETILKVLDGTPLNDHFWTFYGALSNVEYWITVTDAETGLTRRYFNPSRNFASVGDNESFGPRGASFLHTPEPLESTAAAQPIVVDGQTSGEALGLCTPSASRLCLNGGRFAVEATWADFSGNTGDGQAVTLTDDTGYFWFFSDTNVETVLKVLDGRPNNGAYWVFYGSLSNVDFDLTVTDTQTGAVRTYQNRDRRFASVGDTGAFPEP